MAVEVSERTYATGRRKTAVAKVWLMPGTGEIRVNGQTVSEYCGRVTLEREILRPFQVTETEGKFDVQAGLLGVGVDAQSFALRLGVARALSSLIPECHPPLKRARLLTRGPRMKERRKDGPKQARKAPHFSKR